MAASSRQLEVSCSSCGATIVVDALMRTARCLYCDSPSVVDRPATPDRPDPTFVLPFTIDREGAAEAIRQWLRRRWMAPKGLRHARAEQVRGIYVPAYLYSALADSIYSAVIGEVYTTTRVDPRTKKVRRVQEVEYHELKGRHSCYVSDVLVTGSGGLDNLEVEAVEPFDLQQLVPYSPALVSGWIAEEPSVPKERSLELAREEAQGRVGVLLERFMPGDSFRSLKRHTMLRRESADLVLVPVWVFALRHRHDRPPVRFVVNGQNAEVTGTAPVSWAKVAAIAAAILGLAGLIALIGWLL